MAVQKKKQTKMLRQELGLLDIFSIASGAMISSGLFIVPAIAYARTGSSVLFSYILASVLMLPTLVSKAELTTAMPKAGADYFFIDRSMGPAIGTIGGLASWFSLAVKTTLPLIGIGAFVQLFAPSIGDLEVKGIAVAFCVFFTLINLVGVKHTGRLQSVLVFGLIALLLGYVLLGVSSVQHTRFELVSSLGPGSMVSAAGLIFVSFIGLTKVCSVAEEIKRPKRNIPLGLFLAWGIVSLLYIAVVYVTVGVLEPAVLSGTLMPISLGAEVFLSRLGFIVMSIAAVLAFFTSANAGVLSSSRYPMAMAKDQLLPCFLSKMSHRCTPVVSILITAGFMTGVILILDVEQLVQIASTLVLLLFILINLSLILMRESRIRHYRPSFHAPLYPWVQIIGIIGYGVLIWQMGWFPLALVGCFIGAGLLWYWFFARDKIWREYCLLHIIERLTGEKSTSYLVDEELREILIERDNITEKRFEDILRRCTILDVKKPLSADGLQRLIARKFASQLRVSEKKILRFFQKQTCDCHLMSHPNIAIFSHIIEGRNKFGMMVIRSKKGLRFSDDCPPLHAFFVIVASNNLKSFYLHSLMWIVQVAEETDFEEEWMNATTITELRSILRTSWKKRRPM
ncbi:MAG: amino acid permease [Candidatus Thermoplasmatota archaeon]|nr:amino acid permease [Candidatus Thermoplasmatota archaeon]